MGDDPLTRTAKNLKKFITHCKKIKGYKLYGFFLTANKKLSKQKELTLMTHRFFILLFFIWSNKFLSAQVNQSYFSKLNNSNNYEALFHNPPFVDSILKDKQIVLLGELDHGDGTSFSVKTQLIKYLHEKHDYNTLVFEASKINCDILWNSLKSEDDIHKLAKENIYYIWSQVEETVELFNWVADKKKTDNSIKVIGIDPQFSGTNKADAFLTLLKEKLPEDLTQKNEFKFFEQELMLVSTWMSFPKEKEHQITEEKFIDLANVYEKEILKKTSDDKKTLWKIYFENIKLHASIKWKSKEDSFAKRDRQMFRNLNYYLEENKNEKIIVWAANAHIVRNDKQLKGDDIQWLGVKKLGDHIFEHYPERTYSIAFTAGQGKTLNWPAKRKTIKIKKGSIGSLENTFFNFETAFIDLKLFEQQTTQINYEAQLLYPNIKRQAKWSEHFDGLIYIRNMKPSIPKW